MFGFAVRKIFHTLFVALGVVTLVCAALRLSGDPAATMLPEGTRIIHDETRGVELFREVVIYGVSPRVSFRPRADYRLIVSETIVGR